MREYIRNRYHRLRTEWIEKLGGKCVHCESTENLNFDHIIASEKEYDISRILSTHSKTKIIAEMAKCQLLCFECHVVKSVEMEDIHVVSHGGGLTGKKNCYCDLCKPLKSKYSIDKGYRKSAKPKRTYVCGEYRTYKHGCHCDKCRAANTKYMAEFYAKRR